jgi:hypothetical protein
MIDPPSLFYDTTPGWNFLLLFLELAPENFNSSLAVLASVAINHTPYYTTIKESFQGLIFLFLSTFSWI